MAVSSPAIPSRSRLWAAAMKLGRRWLYILHRWVGVATCILCAVWFVSGVVMMYVPFPGLSDHDRMTYSQPLDWSQVQVTPDQAMQKAHASTYPAQVKLTTLEGRPVYRIQDGARRTTVSAVDGTRLDGFDLAQAADIVKRVRPDAGHPRIDLIERDQWTVAQGFNAHRPLYRARLNDSAGTILYVSSATGEIVDDTVRSERMWNWVGSIPHWIYFTVIRQDGAAWRQVILWTSGPALFGAVLGVWVGILRLRIKRRYSEGRVTPYGGWMKWHHLGGLIAGLFLLTWIFSGWLSVSPFGWFDRAPAGREALQRYAGHKEATFPANLPVLRGLGRTPAREARFVWVAGRPLVVSMGPDLVETIVDGRTGQPAAFTDEQIFQSAATLQPGADMESARRLTAEDAYWYSHHTQRRLPVLRVAFDDPRGTWFHIDPVTGEILGRTDSSGRTYRWLFNFLHDFDILPLLAHRPAWDLIMWGLSIGGLIISVSGVVIGWRRLKKKFGWAARA
jgi:uncharacterized iron-regulated membrane protein